MENLKHLTLRQDIWLEVHHYMEDTAPKRSAATRSAEVEEDIQCRGITGQKEQQKVLTELIPWQKVLAEELQKQQKVLAAHIQQQREVLSQQETLNHLLEALVSKPSFLSCYRCGRDSYFVWDCPEPVLATIAQGGRRPAQKKPAGNVRTPPQ